MLSVCLQSLSSSVQSTCAILSSVTYPAIQKYIYIYMFYIISKTAGFFLKLLHIKCVFLFPLQLLSETFLVLRRIKSDIIENGYWSSCREPVIPVQFQLNFIFPERLSKNIQISNFMKIRPVGAELFHADSQT